MARLLIAARSPARAADATRQALELLGSDHTMIVLVVVRPSLVASAAGDGGDPPSGRVDPSNEMVPEDVFASAARAESDVRSELDDQLRDLHVHAELRVRVEIGDPGEAFCRVAAQERVDLIVLGRRNRTLASRLRLGSVTHQVLENSHCPVLVVHEKDD
jgi:nucleotide-binding universal stress UspA family protein